MGYGRQVLILDFQRFTDGKLAGGRTILTPDDDYDRLTRSHVPRDERGDFIFVSFDATAARSQYIAYGHSIAHVLSKPAPRMDGPVA